MEGNGFECPAQALRWGGMGRGIQTRVVLGFDGWRVALAREEMPSGYRWYLTTMVPPEPESSRDYASMLPIMLKSRESGFRLDKRPVSG